ncbi:hypothetical protein BJG92_02103 [Arthrobacter sp. SO5]|nr:hypothetical protein [Arthrobacter sp. SO5]
MSGPGSRTCPAPGPAGGHIPLVPGPGRGDWACPPGARGSCLNPRRPSEDGHQLRAGSRALRRSSGSRYSGFSKGAGLMLGFSGALHGLLTGGRRREFCPSKPPEVRHGSQCREFLRGRSLCPRLLPAAPGGVPTVPVDGRQPRLRERRIITAGPAPSSRCPACRRPPGRNEMFRPEAFVLRQGRRFLKAGTKCPGPQDLTAIPRRRY